MNKLEDIARKEGFYEDLKKPADCPGKRCEQLVSEYKYVEVE